MWQGFRTEWLLWIFPASFITHNMFTHPAWPWLVPGVDSSHRRMVRPQCCLILLAARFTPCHTPRPVTCVDSRWHGSGPALVSSSHHDYYACTNYSGYSPPADQALDLSSLFREPKRFSVSCQSSSLTRSTCRRSPNEEVSMQYIATFQLPTSSFVLDIAGCERKHCIVLYCIL